MELTKQLAKLSIKDRKEKHVWIKEEIYYCIGGEKDHHYISTILKCKKCGALKQ